MFEAFIVFSSLNNSSITLWTHRGHSPFTRKWKYNIIYTYIWYVNSEKLCLKSFLKQPFFSDIPGTYMFVPNRFFYTLEFFLFPKVSCPAFPFILIFSYISFKGRSRYYRTTAWSCMRFAIPVAEESCYEGKGGGGTFVLGSKRCPAGEGRTLFAHSGARDVLLRWRQRCRQHFLFHVFLSSDSACLRTTWQPMRCSVEIDIFAMKHIVVSVRSNNVSL
jgi:hypothetical protein